MGRKRADYIDKALGQLRGKPLTKREIEVVAVILAGHTTDQRIGEILTIANKTVRAHMCHICSKTGAANKADLILMALGRKAGAVDLSNIVWE